MAEGSNGRRRFSDKWGKHELDVLAVLSSAFPQWLTSRQIAQRVKAYADSYGELADQAAKAAFAKQFQRRGSADSCRCELPCALHVDFLGSCARTPARFPYRAARAADADSRTWLGFHRAGSWHAIHSRRAGQSGRSATFRRHCGC